MLNFGVRPAHRARTVATSVIVGLLLGLGLTHSTPVVAVTGSQFDPGNLISDQNFFDSNAMSEGQIASFLQANIGTCLNSNCLNVVRTTTTSRAADPMCSAYTGASSETAASIIYKVQVACGISAKVILVTLQKEQSLVTHQSPTAARLDRAMGYGCPDNAAQPGWCDPAYGGLYNQIYLAARQFKRYGNPPGTSQYFTWFPVGGVSNVSYHPNAACGASPVRIHNRATAALYYYTPYQPNAAALSNLYGTGDSCSSYGNRNFWRMYSDWFGNPSLPAGTPEGVLSSMATGVGSLTLSGWAVDPDAISSSVNISIQVDSAWYLLVANQAGDDMSTSYPGAGDQHAFAGTIQVPPGVRTLCVYLGNQGAGTTGSLGCQTVTIKDTSPRGEIRDIWTTMDGISLWGWAADQDAPTSPLDIRVVTNNILQTWQADQPWQPISDLMPGVGIDHGWGSTLRVGAGDYSVCVYAVNKGAGADTNLGCRNVTVPSGSPKAEIRGLWTTTAGISLWGWAIDPDSLTLAAPISIQVDSSWYAWQADQEYLPAKDYVEGAGERHGWGGTLAASPGAHTICVYVGNRGAGTDISLGCRVVTVPDGSPRGEIKDVWATTAGISLWGWAMDADVPGQPIKLSIQVDSNWYVWDADQPYAPAQSYMAGAGPNHGWGGTVLASAGPHTVCVYPINQGAGNPVSFGCRTVVMPDASPIGEIRGLWTSPTGISLWGWAIDPDSLDAAVPLSIQVDSSWYLMEANLPYLPAKGYLAGAGDNHGWGGTIPASPGRHTICVYPVNRGSGSNTTLGCYSVVV